MHAENFFFAGHVEASSVRHALIQPAQHACIVSYNIIGRCVDVDVYGTWRCILGQAEAISSANRGMGVWQEEGPRQE
jgi:hypothetical protein